MKKRYKMFQAPLMAFFSPSFYRDVGLHWKGTGFIYLLLLLAFCWIPTFIQFHLSVSDYIKNKAPAIISQLPQITIIKGNAFAAVAQPYKIIEPDTKMILVLIDTTGKTTSLEETGAIVLVTKTGATVRKNDYETRTFSFKNIDHFTLDQQRVAFWMEIFRRYAALVFYPFAVVGSFAFRIVQVLLYAAIGFVFARWLKTENSYQSLLRLSVMAVTPAIIVRSVFRVAHVEIPFAWLLYFAAAMIYLFVGVKAASHEKKD